VDEDSQLVIHVGFPKTGTTWLQNTIFSNSDLGFYPVGGQPKYFGEKLVPFSKFGLRSECDFDVQSTLVEFDTLLAEVPAELTSVISNEVLVGHMFNGGVYIKSTADLIYKLFPKAKIIITIREQGSIFRSIYEHYLRKGGLANVSNFVVRDKEAFTPLFDFSYIEYDITVSYYQRLFGVDNVLVLPFEMLRLYPRTYIEKILSFSNLSQNIESIDGLDFAARNKTDRKLAAVLHFFRFLNLLDKPRNLNGRAALAKRNYVKFIAPKLVNICPSSLVRMHEERCNAVFNKHASQRVKLSNANLERITGLSLGEFGYLLDSTS
jgi:hypothetical protein